MREKSKAGLNSKELITIGVFSVLLLMCAMITGGPFATIPTLTFFYPVGAAILAGPVFMLFVAKVPKVSGLMIVGVVLCILGTLTGMHWGMNFGYLVFCCIAAFVASLKDFKNMVLNVIAYIIYSLGPMGTYLVFFFNRQSWISFMLNKGTQQDYIDQMNSVASTQMIISMILGTVIVALLSGLLGVRLMKKQFIKAGIAA